MLYAACTMGEGLMAFMGMGAYRQMLPSSVIQVYIAIYCRIRYNREDRIQAGPSGLYVLAWEEALAAGVPGILTGKL